MTPPEPTAAAKAYAAEVLREMAGHLMRKAKRSGFSNKHAVYSAFSVGIAEAAGELRSRAAALAPDEGSGR